MTKSSIAALVTACVLAAGCGGEETNADRFEGDEAAVAEVVDRLGEAAREGDVKTICEDLVTVELQRSVREASGASCGEEFEQNIVSDETTYRVQSIEVDGRSATARVVDQEDRRSAIAFMRVGEDWRISSIR